MKQDFVSLSEVYRIVEWNILTETIQLNTVLLEAIQ